jgi:ribonuclease-3
MTPPDYVLIAREGPDHAPRFVIEARLSTGEVEQAEGATKRAAEHAAAAAMLGRLDG